MTALHYTLHPAQPHAHIFEITLTVAEPDPAGQTFSLPAWIPGSYMVREFARHIVRIRASCADHAVTLTKLDKHSWRAAPCMGPLTVWYEVYAWDLSVRAAHFDTTHAFFNGSSVFLAVEGQTHRPHRVELLRPSGESYRDWRVVTALPEARGKGGARRYGFGVYEAPDYDALIDHPVEMGTFALAHFEACGVMHDVAITGQVPNLDRERLVADLQPICEAQIRLFEPDSAQAPMARYVFMTMVTSDGYGGLEHRASTALICARGDLPVKGQAEMSEGYRSYLGLCSHEYFHTWNVKRIKPAVFAPYDLRRENYTRLLWLFEGFTSYYDDLILVRSGRITSQDYLALVEKNLNAVLRGSGRHKQSVADSSFDAWTKYYRQDENAPNAIVSYYAKGALVALGLDLKLRAVSRGKCSLDEVMRLLWQRYGRGWYTPAGACQGVPEEALQAVLVEVGGAALQPWLEDFFARYVEGTQDVPVAEWLPALGVEAVLAAADGKSSQPAKPSLGIKTGNEGGWVKLTQVHDGGAAQQAGLSAGDLLASLGGLRVTPGTPNALDALLARYQVGDMVEVLAFRRDEALRTTVQLKADGALQYRLSLMAASGRRRPAWQALRTAWLGER